MTRRTSGPGTSRWVVPFAEGGRDMRDLLGGADELRHRRRRQRRRSHGMGGRIGEQLGLRRVLVIDWTQGREHAYPRVAEAAGKERQPAQ